MNLTCDDVDLIELIERTTATNYQPKSPDCRAGDAAGDGREVAIALLGLFRMIGATMTTDRELPERLEKSWQPKAPPSSGDGVGGSVQPRAPTTNEDRPPPPPVGDD